VTISTLLEKLGTAGVRLRIDAGELRVAGNRAALDAETVDQLRAHKAALLEIVGSHGEAWWSPAQPVSTVRDRCIHTLFEAQVERTPDAVALVCGDRSLSYAELNARANQLAHHLVDRGVGPGTRVAICMERGPEVIVGVLGVLKAGGAYVPLDPRYPVDQLRYMLADCEPVVLLGHGLPVGLLEGIEVPMVDLGAEASEWAGRPRSNPERESVGLTPAYPAYVIYTSGSTGQPKGVIVEHRSACRQLAAVRAAFQLGGRDRCLQFASITFDVSVEEVFGTLLSGAALVLRDDRWLESPRAFWTRCEAHGVSVVDLPTRFWQLLVVEPDVSIPACVRLVVIGGEAVDPGALSAWFQRDGHRPRLLNLYGPTETTVNATLHEVTGDASAWRSIGRPMLSTRVYILDAGGEPVPTGVTGEIHIGGGQVARGYLGRPGLTAERFVPDPFGGEPGARMYRTGDLGRWLADGRIEFLGRTDFQVKVRGFRIEPGEIETVLRTHPRVGETVVAVREDSTGERRLVAYVVPTHARGRPELWPSVGEYPIYDDLLYRAMVSDGRRNAAYREALQGLVEGRTVVDVGTGSEVLLARMCVEAGARRVYAVEVQEDSFQRACERVSELGLEDWITVIHGDATSLELPEAVDVCVSELIGSIGGSEGAVAILDHARRWLKPGGVMVPRRCETWIAAATLPDELHAEPGFGELAARYAERVMEASGHREDLRLCVKDFPAEALLSDAGIFEELDFARPIGLSPPKTVELRIARDGRLDGFLLWIRLYAGERLAMDSLRHEGNWLPVFFPVFYPGLEVRAGETLSLECSASLSEDGLHPDYHLRGLLRHRDGREEAIAYDSFHRRPPARPGALHTRLVSAAGVRVTPAADPVPLSTELREFLRERVPEYMVPAAYVRLEEMPLTPSGKLDRTALPAPRDDAYARRAYEAPAGEAEEALARIWAELLGVERVGRWDHFFELGGHSLLAVQVVSRVQQVLGVDARLGDVFERPVLADFGRGLEQATRAELPAIEPVDRTGPLPLSFAQQRLWFLDQMGGVGTAYHIPTRLRLMGALDREALTRALDRIVERHEALRTTFTQAGGEPVQCIFPPEESRFALREHDLGGQADAAAELRRLVGEESGAPFDLERGPLIRGRLIRMAADDHVLLITMHHVVSDGWSMGVFTRELSALYGAFRRGEGDPLPELPVQYADYAAWQRRWVGGEVLEQQAAYWHGTLAGAPERLELPTDRPRPARQSFAGGTVSLELDEELTAGLRALSRRHGTTPFMTLLAGWAAVLGRLSGQEDVVVGTPTANRGRQEIEGLIGFFVNTLALRVELTGSPTVAELLGRVKKRALEAQAHQDIPFEQVVERVQPVRSLSHTPLFQVMFAWQNAPGGGLDLPGLSLARVGGTSQGTAKFDLSLTLGDRARRIVGGVQYATSLYEQATVERYIGYLRRVLEAMAADEHRTVAQLPMLPAAERRQLVQEWNLTDAPFPSRLCIHELFQARAQRTPAAVAVVHEDRSLTYARLNAWANRLAHLLRARGAGPESCVAVLVPRSIELVVAELAILKAGAAYVPIDPSLPAERIAFMLADSACRLVLAVEGDALPELGGAQRLDVDALAEGAEDDPRGGGDAEAAAYVMYTSGSTGRPKGVVVPHRAVTRLVLNSGYADFRAEDRVAFAANPAFDAATMEVWAPLLNGGRIVVIGQDVLLEPGAFARLLEDQGVTVLFVTTAVFNQYAATMATALTGLRLLLTGGERADPASFARVLREGGPQSLINCYGPTETTTFAVTHEIRSVEEGAQSIPLGRPMANARIYILDRAGEPVPVGVAGGLYVGGAGVARGYLNRPELTAERFVPDPFGGEPGARMYRTGDVGRWLADGTIEFLGRSDFQVKIRGFRIEPGEIEARLTEHPGVREAVVVARGDAPGDKRLVAYYTAPEALDAGALREHLSERLPEYMVPAAYVRLEALPLTPSGKLDRKALPAPEDDAHAMRAYEAPAGEAEEALARIWAELLGVERVGRWNHFFELGGHSLLAVQVVSRVRQVLGVEARLGDVFERPVLADFGRGLEQAARAELPAIEPVDRTGPLPLSFAQQRLWFLEQMGGVGTAYHIPTRLRLTGALDREALTRALDRVVERHEALRTTFTQADGEPVQRIFPPEESRFALREHDLGGQADAAAELRRLVEEETGAPFDLERGPLIRGRLIRMAADDHVLLITMHHIVSDGWSMGVLTRELSALYGAFRRGEGDPLPELPVQYADYAAWQRRRVAGEVLHEQAEYWKQTLSGAPELLELPTDHPRPLRQDHAGGSVPLVLGEALAAGLKALGQRQGTTLFMTLLAGWAAVLSRLSGQEDVVIGTPTANRGRREIEGLIGFLVNTLALRVELTGSPTVAELLGRVKKRALEAQAHQDIPFEQVVERVQPVRSLSHTPLFQVMFAWQNAPGGSPVLPGLRPASMGAPAEQRTAKFDLTMSLHEAGGRIVGGISYATALFERATVERHLGYLRHVLEAMAADEHQTVDQLPMLPEAERRQLLEEWSATAAEFPGGECVHELFERQAERTPGAPALVHENEVLTYAELDARANRLAHHLRARGVGPETRVGICMERTPDLVVSVLATLKAGGAYVPLDPAYPRERLGFMLEDAAVEAVLTTTGLAGRLPPGRAEALCLDALREEVATRSDTAPGSGVTPQNLSHVIFTSGSTGRPKGVMIRHSSVVVLLHWLREVVSDGERASVLFSTSINFDVSIAEVFGTLCWGGKLVLVENALQLAGVREPVTYASMVPTAAAELLRTGGIPASVRTLNLGGEALPNELAQGLYALGTVERVGNLYGPTEDTTYSTYSRVGKGADRVLIGRPVPGTRAYVLDGYLSPVPVGTGGELYLAGEGLARGYAGRPELTAERFLPDPFGPAGSRMYRVMDRVRWRAGGELEYLGRLDHQVKVRGYRIEPGEIEARLAEHPAVREATVLAREDGPGSEGRRLVAYYVGEEAGAEALRAHLSERLPEYMLPAAYVRLDGLPLTPNGKLDRGALPAPGYDAYARRGYEAPEGETEQALARIWSELLGVEQVGRRDGLFDLGGHSLLAVQVIHRVRQALGRELTLVDLFVQPTLADLARKLETAERSEQPTDFARLDLLGL
jgi:amino acid adenylation domain-containing protein